MREFARESLTDKPKSDLKQLLDTKKRISLSPLRSTNLENKLSFYLAFYITSINITTFQTSIKSFMQIEAITSQNRCLFLTISVEARRLPAAPPRQWFIQPPTLTTSPLQLRFFVSPKIPFCCIYCGQR